MTVRRRAGTPGRIVVALARRGRLVFVDAPFVQAALAVAAPVDGGPVQGVLADHVVDGRAQVSELFLQVLALDSRVLSCIVTGADDRAGGPGDLRGVGGEPGQARPGVAADAVRDGPVAGHQLAPFARTGWRWRSASCVTNTAAICTRKHPSTDVYPTSYLGICRRLAGIPGPCWGGRPDDGCWEKDFLRFVQGEVREVEAGATTQLTSTSSSAAGRAACQ